MRSFMFNMMMILVANTCYAAGKSDSDLRNEHFLSLYNHACQLTPQVLHVPPQDKEHAVQQEIVLDKAYSFIFTAKNTQYYLQLATINWDERFIVMVNDDVSLNIKGVDKTGDRIPNYACLKQKRVIHHFNTHEWASYIMSLTTSVGENVWITIMPERIIL